VKKSLKYTFPLLSLLLVGQTQNRPAIHVCEVLRNLQKYRNLEISVRGEWVYTDHGMTLRESCDTPLTTSGHVWPNGIWLAYPWLRDEEEKPVDYKLDQRKMKAALRRAGKISGQVYATFTGKLQARESLTVFVSSSGPKGYGFGHLNTWPAQIVIRTVDNVSSTP
jgi:hypothetical protein